MMKSAARAFILGPGFQLLVLTVAFAAAVYAKTALGPLQETMRHALSLSDNQMALLLGPALVFSMAILAIPLGLIIDRYVRVRLMFISVMLLLLGSLLTAWASDYAMLFLGRVLVGLGALSVNPVVLSLIADLYPPDQRGRASMMTLVGQYIGWGVVFAAGGKLVTMFGMQGDAWRWALSWMTVPPLVSVALLMLTLREPRRTERKIKNPSSRESFLEFWRYRAMAVTLIGGAMFKLIALHSMLNWAAPAMARGFSLQPDQVGVIMATLLPVGGIGGSLAGGWLADVCQRRGGPRMTVSVIGTMVFVGAPLCLFAVAPTVMWSCVMLTLSIAILTAAAHMAVSTAMVIIPNELRGLYFGTSLIAGMVGIGLAPVLVSLLSGALGGPTMIGQSLVLVCTMASVLCAVVYALGRKRFEPAFPA